MKKLIFRIFFIPFFLAGEAFNLFCLLLDELVFHAYKKTVVAAPVYITGMPRTGTTLMHNILFLDQERFTSMKLWEIAFAPSLLQKKMYLLIKKADAILHYPLTRLLKSMEKVLLKGFISFHPLGLFDIEEDEYLMIHSFSSALMPFFLPGFRQSFPATMLRNNENAGLRRSSVFYRSCVKKHLYVFGKGRTYLAKSPAHFLRLDQLKIMFPDLKLIYMLRVPHQVIPSTISLFSHFNDIFHAGIRTGEIVEQILSLADICLGGVTNSDAREDDQAFSLTRYEEFIANPVPVVTGIYERFGFGITGSFDTSMRKYCGQQAGFISRHVYSPEKYHLTREMIISRYKKVYEKYYPSEIIMH